MLTIISKAFYDSSIGMAIVSLEGKWLQVNKSLCAMLEYTPEELTQKTFQEIIHPDDLAVDNDLVARCVKGEIDTYRTEKRYFTKSGRIIWVLLTVSLITEDNTQNKFFVSQMQDITELRSYKETTAAALEAGGIGIWTWYAESDHLVWDETMFRIFGLDHAKFNSKYESLNAILHIEDRGTIESLIKNTPGEFFSTRLRSFDKNNNLKHIAFKGRRKFFSNGKLEVASGICYDITKVVKNEIDIANSNAELEQFAFAISHDLQEPLRTISSFVSLAKKNEKKLANNQTNRYLDLIDTSANRAKTMIKDLLDFSRASSTSKPCISNIDTVPIVHDICKSLSASIKEKNANIIMGNMSNIRMEPYHFSMIMQNLISNAIKYAKDETPPQVSINMSENEEEWLIVVEDNGIGIEQKNIERLFQPFVRVGPKSKDGTGLGLALCKKIVSLYFGKIWLTSSLDNGTQVFVAIPKNYEEAKKLS